jgi:hypothetical protein
MITAAASRSNLRRPAIPCSPRSDRVWRQTGGSGGGALCPSPEAYVERHKKHARSPVVKWAASSANVSAGHSSSRIVIVSLAGIVAAAECGGWSFRSELARNPENP